MIQSQAGLMNRFTLSSKVGNRTPLHNACCHGHIDDVRELLNQGADMEAVDDCRENALQIACSWGRVEVVRELLDRGANIEDTSGCNELTPLHKACYYQHINLLKELLDRGANIEAASSNGGTPLHSACRDHGGDEIVRELLDRGANIDARDIAGETPLFRAIMNCGPSILSLLLSRGASVNAVNSKGSTALHVACRAGKLEAAIALLDHGADVNACNGRNCTPLIVSISFRHDGPSLVQPLLARGALVNIADEDGNAPLHYTGDLSTLTALLDAGAAIDHRNNDGKTALEMACRWLSVDKVKLLLSRGASFSDVETLLSKVPNEVDEIRKQSQRVLINIIEEYAVTHYVMK